MTDGGLIESHGGNGAAEPAPAQRDAAVADQFAPFDFNSILGVADAIPVMIAFCDTGLRYRFVNRALAEWLEAPRSAILGRTMREVLGNDAFAMREALIDAALGGERQWFATE